MDRTTNIFCWSWSLKFIYTVHIKYSYIHIQDAHNLAQDARNLAQDARNLAQDASTTVSVA